MKKVKTSEKRTTSRAEMNKRRIKNKVFLNLTVQAGTILSEIIKYCKTSKPTVLKHLRELERDDEIKKIGKRYFVKPYFDDDGLSFYATILKEFVMRRAYNRYKL